jgi:NAD(P)-dependent dehydrogenase (short-subunit alcohol dehydrogenase family)
MTSSKRVDPRRSPVIEGLNTVGPLVAASGSRNSYFSRMNNINFLLLISAPQTFHTLTNVNQTQLSERIPMGKLQGKVAVITGATSGMALATAKRFVTEGAYVFITGRRQKELDSAVAAIGRSVTGVQGDASVLADMDRLYRTVKDQKGSIDVLYASAGLGEFNIPLGKITEETFAKTFDLNVRGTLFTVQKALPLMRDGGSIIMTGSIASVKGFEGMSLYNASKAAVRSFARSWTSDLKTRRIRVNVISPGPIETAVFAGVPQEVKNTFVSLVPMGRIGQPEEIASAALFLASDDSSFITGIELFVDGGTAQI